MSADIIVLDHMRRPEPAADPNATLEAALRAFLAVEEALEPWSDSTLIAGLAGATLPQRQLIIAEFEARAWSGRP